MENRASFDLFMKSIVVNASHPVFYSFLSRKEIWKMFLKDSLIVGMVYGLACVRNEISIMAVWKSWKLCGYYVALLICSGVLAKFRR